MAIRIHAESLIDRIVVAVVPSPSSRQQLLSSSLAMIPSGLEAVINATLLLLL
jgi:hypothetical protein